MWISYFNWFLALLSIMIWGGTYIVWERDKFMSWLDNKFGKDDPMPPMPKQNIPLNTGENVNFSYEAHSDSNKEHK